MEWVEHVIAKMPWWIISSFHHLRQTICHKTAEASPPIPHALLTGWLWPKFSCQEEKSMFLLEFERADNDRSNATGPLRISHKRWCHFLLVLLKMLSCWRKFKLPMWKDHMERPHIGAVSDNPAEFPTDRKQTPGMLSDKISRWLQSPAFESTPALGLQSWDLGYCRADPAVPYPNSFNCNSF